MIHKDAVDGDVLQAYAAALIAAEQSVCTAGSHKQGTPADTSAWVQQNWDKFASKLEAAGWVLDRPRLPLQPWRAAWQEDMSRKAD